MSKKKSCPQKAVSNIKDTRLSSQTLLYMYMYTFKLVAGSDSVILNYEGMDTLLAHFQ